jgi:hypothetical protein
MPPLRRRNTISKSSKVGQHSPKLNPIKPAELLRGLRRLPAKRGWDIEVSKAAAIPK